MKTMGKVINMITGLEDEFIPLEKARAYIIGKKPETIINRRSLLNKIYHGDFPPGTVTKSLRGNWYFSKNYLMGLTIPNKAA